MIKNSFLLLLILGTTIVACQNSEKKLSKDNIANNAVTSESSAPVSLTNIQWIDSAVNKGTIAEGEKIEIVYRFKNTGEKPLVIKDVRPSCGCTVAEKPLEPIAPGEEGSIKAVFDSHNKPGPNHKTITVVANTQQETYGLTFEVLVNKKS
ncbi:MAG TPA: DUF1573 domain-containing protein [Agriterribacter sp.]|nr:DUF1573 domain-containing protein [Agriterribacter sp.]